MNQTYKKLMKNWLEKIFGKDVWYVPLIMLALWLVAFIWLPRWLDFVVTFLQGYAVCRFFGEPLLRWITLNILRPIGEWIRNLFKK